MWYSLAILSAVFSASAAIFEKKALQSVSALNFSFILALFNIILSLPFLYFINYSALGYESVLVLYAKSVLGAVSFLLVMQGLKNLEISSALPLLVLTPGVVALAAFLVLGTKLNVIEIGGMVLLLFGTYVLQIKGNLIKPWAVAFNNKAYLYILGAVILFSTTSILDKALLSNYKLQPEAFLPIQHVFFALNFSIILLFSPANKLRLKPDFKKVWKLALIVSVFTIVYRYSHILAVKAGSVALVLSIKRTSVFFATVIGGSYFHDKGLVRKSVATIIMIAGAILIILN